MLWAGSFFDAAMTARRHTVTVDMAYALHVAEGLGRKFEPTDIQEDAQLGALAAAFVSSFEETGAKTDDFMSSLQYALQKYGSITAGQAKGALNVAVANARYAARSQQTEPEEAADVRRIPNGSYTIVLEDDTHVTLDIRDDFRAKRDSRHAGKQMVSYLYGPDNTHDFKGFAFLNGSTAHCWKSFSGDNRISEALLTLVNCDQEALWAGRLAYAMASGSCSRCHRKLTVPASVYRGLGPECYKIIGG